jgi:CDP-diacylglycerol--glycerol-3-phosphate 3-phosphatidyltransferase
MLARVPNALTTARLVALVPFCILLLGASNGQSTWAAVIFAAASATDFLDGYIARHAHVQSRFGRIADPLADRLLINLTLIILGYENRLSWWLVAPLLLRDIYLMITFERRRVATEVQVNKVGKWATAAIMFALLTMMLTPAVWPVVLYCIGLALSIVAAGEYLARTQGGLTSKPS